MAFLSKKAVNSARSRLPRVLEEIIRSQGLGFWGVLGRALNLNPKPGAKGFRSLGHGAGLRVDMLTSLTTWMYR